MSVEWVKLRDKFNPETPFNIFIKLHLANIIIFTCYNNPFSATGLDILLKKYVYSEQITDMCLLVWVKGNIPSLTQLKACVELYHCKL